MSTSRNSVRLGVAAILLTLCTLVGCKHDGSFGRLGRNAGTYAQTGLGTPHCPDCAAGSAQLRPEAVASSGTARSGDNSVAVTPYGGQTTCPVTDEELGSMGPPVPVAVKGQTIYVCCAGCAASVRSDPDVYLAKVAAERSGQ